MPSCFGGSPSNITMRDCVCNKLMNRRFRTLLRHYFDYDDDDNGLSPEKDDGLSHGLSPGEVLAELDSICKAFQESLIFHNEAYSRAHWNVAVYNPMLRVAMMWTFFPMEPGGSGGARWWWWSPA
ncbi:hypothetical protein CH63R_14342 [Colletotrichum higginsianum IMI 349063]|uniref:Uncharacterized protein n=1 Tax=Colletotrichum higginsianum (strain IMI 349063) TaxID=759273 RepID=A0A1B7XTN3_COLHI|nr:hypothetical protein CH63R_14342 [Colletotrichum higginsianum IMI 349063]OBR03116.1 hypothetical protein CH63R_14342 [Colletotrichum higginsianum IMI 349063]